MSTAEENSDKGNSKLAPATILEFARANRVFSGMLLTVCAVFIWSYWPTLVGMASIWSSVSDYSHGFLVAPVAIFVLWSRRAQIPTFTLELHWGGLVLIALASGFRILSGLWFIDAVDGWSMVVWIAGAVWLFGGLPLLRWAAPAIGFLFFMVPLPFSLETMLSVPLQRIATSASGWILQSLGQPALAEGTTLVLGDQRLDIERACSGLRMFTGVLALAYIYTVFSRRPVWDKAIIVLATLPLAMLANTFRIVATGLLFQLSANPAFHQWVHDSAGWLTILVAAAMMAGLSFYLSRLISEVEVMRGRNLIRSVNS